MTHTDTLTEYLKTAGALPEVTGQAAQLASSGQLHELMAKTAGVADFDMDAALRELGKKIYLKNASWTIVRQGLEASAALTEKR